MAAAIPVSALRAAVLFFFWSFALLAFSIVTGKYLLVTFIAFF
jgi:hypothetical protein